MRNTMGMKSLTVAASLALALTTAANASINLEWRSDLISVPVGTNFSIGLYAVSDNLSNQSISAVDTVLNWDSSLLQLTGLTNNSPYSWGSSSFPNDCGLDGLNGDAVCPSYTGLVANDGSAFYRAQRNLGAPAFATPAGLLVATFNFTSLAPVASTLLTIPNNFGLFTETVVVDGVTAGLPVTGLLGNAKITITPEPASLALLAMGAAVSVRRRRTR